MEKASSTKEPLCRQKVHRKVLDKGLPEDVTPGILDLKVGNWWEIFYLNYCLNPLLGRFATSSSVRSVKQTWWKSETDF